MCIDGHSDAAVEQSVKRLEEHALTRSLMAYRRKRSVAVKIRAFRWSRTLRPEPHMGADDESDARDDRTVAQ
jgi:hypothetical protein